jgi:hypothetical protein
MYRVAYYLDGRWRTTKRKEYKRALFVALNYLEHPSIRDVQVEEVLPDGSWKVVATKERLQRAGYIWPLVRP